MFRIDIHLTKVEGHSSRNDVITATKIKTIVFFKGFPFFLALGIKSDHFVSVISSLWWIILRTNTVLDSVLLYLVTFLIIGCHNQDHNLSWHFLTFFLLSRVAVSCYKHFPLIPLVSSMFLVFLITPSVFSVYSLSLQ